MEPREIGQRIARAREARGLTQVAFAFEANVSPSTVQRWEGGRLPPVRELIRIASVLQIEPEELVEPNPTPDSELHSLREEVAELHAMLAELLGRSA